MHRVYRMCFWASRRVQTLIVVGVAFTATLRVFWQPLTPDRTLFAPDCVPYYADGHGGRVLQGLWGVWSQVGYGEGHSGRAFHPSKALAILLPPLIYHVAVYILDTLLLVLASLYFLRGRRVRWLSAVLASLALAYSGYLFTLIAAGHRSMFNMLPYAVFLFGLIDRGFERKSLFHFAMIGICGAFGLMAQPDVMGLLCLVLAPYAVLRFVKSWPRHSGGGRHTGQIALGAVVTLLVFAPFSLSLFGHLFAEVVPNRDIDRGSAERDQWEYATNWSMPPEEMVEFIAPGVYGHDTGNPQGPYWGRVGRTLGWEESRRGLMNLKQHTVYMGVLQLVFAVYAVVWLVKKRGRRGVRHAKDGEVDAVGTSHGGISFGVAEVWFFVAVFVIGLLLALGRYSPVYRVFYSIPFCDKIRAPIKFLHYCEIALAFLFAFGLDRFFTDLRTQASAMRRRFTGFWVAGLVMAVVLLGGMLLLHSFRPGLESYWQQLGFGRYTAVMFQTMRGALLHGMVLFLVVAGVFGLARFMRNSRKALFWAIGLVSVALLTDLTVVARKYVRVRDVSSRYESNSIAEKIMASGPCRVSYRIPQLDRFGDFRGSFEHHGLDMLEPGRRRTLSAEAQQLYSALSTNAFRLWQLTNTRFILGDSKELISLAQHPAFEVADTFDAYGGRAESRGPAGGGAYSLVEFKAALPKVVFYPDWKTVIGDEAWSWLTSDAWNPGTKALVEGAPDADVSGVGPSAAKVEKYKPTLIRVAVNAPTDGVLVVNDAYHKDWKVTVDGESAQLLRCNVVMRGVGVPMGQHEVVFRYRPYWWRFIAAMSMCGILLVWAVVRGVLWWRKRGIGD